MEAPFRPSPSVLISHLFFVRHSDSARADGRPRSRARPAYHAVATGAKNYGPSSGSYVATESSIYDDVVST